MSEEEMGPQNKLFVGNLSYTATDSDIMEAFSQFGEVVEAKVIVDKMSGRSKGFAFVTMSDDASAQKALELNDKEVAGRPVKVSIARPMRPRDDSDRGYRN